MSSLKSRTQCPPNGFIHTEAQTGWTHQWWDFELACREIRDHRLGNPRFNLSTDIDDIRVELDQENALRCLSIRGADIYVNGDSPPPKPIARQQVAVVAGVVKSGLQITGSWLGKGGVPVSKDLANQRAEICSTCPKNGRGSWTRYFTVPAAALLKKEIERRNKMKLSTPFDEKLNVCEVCNCPLHLKVHTPLADIVDNMKPEVRTDLDPRCWILKE